MSMNWRSKLTMILSECISISNSTIGDIIKLMNHQRTAMRMESFQRLMLQELTRTQSPSLKPMCQGITTTDTTPLRPMKYHTLVT
jgi:hypothetical protein